jgi:hypothetical protein
MIVEKQMECRLAGETEVLLGENLPKRHFCPMDAVLTSIKFDPITQLREFAIMLMIII